MALGDVLSAGVELIDVLDNTALRRWQADPEAFIREVLRDPESGKAFVLNRAERRFLKHAFKRARGGRLKFTEWLFSAPKKSGKTAWAAILVLTVVLVFGGRFA